MQVLSPIVASTDRAAALAALHRCVPAYLPEWQPAPDDLGSALLAIHARYLELLADGLNRVPERAFLAFLDSLATTLLPAQAARAPLMFSMMKDAPVDSLLQANSQVAAPAAKTPPSPLLPAGDAPDEQPVVFATTQTISLLRGKLAALYSLAPGDDSYGDHAGALTTGFSLFDEQKPVEHALYLGHYKLFELPDAAEVQLIFALGPTSTNSPPRKLEIGWEYLSDDGWLPLALDPERDHTDGLTTAGTITLRKTCGPNSKLETLQGRKSFWLRGRTIASLSPAGELGPLPILNSIRARVVFTKSNLDPDAAFADTATLDTSKNFFPFGQQPARYSVFYLASDAAFQRGDARIAIDIKLSEVGVPEGSLKLVWEYNNGNGWSELEDYELFDDTAKLTKSGRVTFRCPPDWAEAAVNGVKKHWLRVRITNGSYGHPLQVKAGTTVLEASSLAPPVVATLKLNYTYQTNSFAPNHCLTFNDFTFTDRSDAVLWGRRFFEPFQVLTERDPAVHLGFDKPLPNGLVSIYVETPEGSEAVDEPVSSAFIWEYRGEEAWHEISVLDDTNGFTRSGVVQFVGPQDAVAAAGLGGDLFRVRARLKQGAQPTPRPVAGLWLNAVWATHRTDVSRETLGISDGNPGQTFHFKRQRVPVMEGEVLEVREWAGPGADWRLFAEDIPPADLRLERDTSGDNVVAVWARWHGRPQLFASSPDDRDYVIERATGWVKTGGFGMARLIPAGARVVASYTSGGGLRGNVGAGAITELRCAAPYLEKASNPVAAGGGAEAETIATVKLRGPQRLRHRDRAIAPGDYEWLARDATPAIARARCLAVTGPEGRVQPGRVTLIVLPQGTEPMPQPSRELRRQVRDYVAARMPAAVMGGLRVVPPSYVNIGIVAAIVPQNPGESATVEARLLLRLGDFLHPLRGGPAGTGWDFGQHLQLSDIARLIETTEGVDHAVSIGLRTAQRIFVNCVPIPPDSLISAGHHELTLMIGER